MIMMNGLLTAVAALMATAAAQLKVARVTSSTLGTDPEGSARLNGMSFQQDALVTFNGWQYVAYYESTGTYNAQNVALGRRNLSSNAGAGSDWETLRLTDYVQRTQDSHNTISMGISADGRIHLSYDHHDVALNYRASNAPVAADPAAHAWGPSLFGTTLHGLPGAGAGPWSPVTYPRFERFGDDLLFEMRIGASGSGDSYLYKYPASSGPTGPTGGWVPIGRYLQGRDNNAYINGLDAQNGTLHTTWTWRETPDVVTNHDLAYVYSPDEGRTWHNDAGQVLGTTVTPSSPGIRVFDIPQRSGILNQEGQAVGPDGAVHVLNRELRGGGVLTWILYRRPPGRAAAGAWTRVPVQHSLGPLTQTGRRGKLAVHGPTGEVLAVLASNTGNDVAVVAAGPGDGYASWREIWRGAGYDVEPLYDRELWRGHGGVAPGRRLSLFLNTAGGYPDRKVTVVDLDLEW